ncbi:hypothetical protein [Tessaracoccus massiliensis]|uniref:hypothetical protein n=1 Tax=Tessaracoccus massiliensis TaxID=1522311 RepID=UPI00058DB885|nr:hypothetical protein [Tessaracoccus massiliensis]
MTDEEFDDELLAPPSDVATDPAPVVDDPAAGAEDKWLPAHGFTDARLAVRIWVEESSRQITRVHVSPRWREVLGPNRGLDAAFGEAFFAASVRVGGDASLPTFSTGDIQDEESHHSLPDEEEVQERVLVLLEKQAALAARPPQEVRWAQFDGEQTVVTKGPVTLSLSLAGIADSVSFDRAWLQSAESEAIATGVLQAARLAYDKYTPPVLVPGEHEELAQEFARAQRDLLTIMEKGSR